MGNRKVSHSNWEIEMPQGVLILTIWESFNQLALHIADFVFSP